MSAARRPPDGCPGCNPEKVMRFLHDRNIEVEELPPEVAESPAAIVCDKCGRAWLLMPRRDITKASVS